MQRAIVRCSKNDIICLPPADPAPLYGRIANGGIGKGTWLRLSRRLGGLVDNLVCSDEELEQALLNKIALSKAAKKREGTLIGRIYNRLSGADPEYILLTGAHFRQTLPLITGAPLPTHQKFVACKLRYQLAEKALAKLTAQIDLKNC